jgi:hypothetical protein
MTIAMGVLSPSVRLDSAPSIHQFCGPIHYHVSEDKRDGVRAVQRRDSDPRCRRPRPRAGDLGTVVDRHVVPDTAEERYSVEFFDMIDNTVAVVTVAASAVRLPTPTDRPAVRALTA